MKIVMPLFLILIVSSSCQDTAKKKPIVVNYPTTSKVDSVDTYFGTSVPDPYRWLEADTSAATEAWVKEQNRVTFGYLEEIPFRAALKNRLEKLWNYEKLSSPFKEGDFTYYYKNDGLQNQYVVYRKKNDGGNAEVFLDPNTFSKDGTTSLQGLSFTKDGSLAAYLISEGGSDWRKAIVLNAGSKEIVEDTLGEIKFSDISWKGNEGFYYSSYDKPKGSQLSAKTDQHKVYYHQLGTPQSSDKLVFGGNPSEKHRYIGAGVTEDQRFLVITASNSTSGNKLFIKDLTQPNGKLTTILENTDTDSYIIENVGSK